MRSGASLRAQLQASLAVAAGTVESDAAGAGIGWRQAPSAAATAALLASQPVLALGLAVRAPSGDLGNGTTACLVQGGEEDAAWVLSRCWLHAALGWVLRNTHERPHVALRPGAGAASASVRGGALVDAAGWGVQPPGANGANGGA